MIVEIKPSKDNPYRVEFFADGKKLINISATRVQRRGDILIANAVVTFDKRASLLSSKPSEDDGFSSASIASGKKGRRKSDSAGKDVTAETEDTNKKGEAE